MIGPICMGVNKCGWRGTVIGSSPLKWGVIHNFEQPSTRMVISVFARRVLDRCGVGSSGVVEDPHLQRPQPSTAGAAGTTVNELRGTQAEAAARL
jgi:hypothetical protein